MSDVKSRASGRRDIVWWRTSRGRNKVWAVLAATAVAVGIGVFVWLTLQGGHMGGEDDPVAIGQSVEPFTLPDIVSGQEVSLGDYLGKQEIVIVSYMGFFCVGCEELLAELQERQGDFSSRGATLLVLGSKPESVDVGRAKAEEHGITYPILHDAGTSVTRNVGLWSDSMQMPLMGYVVIDRSRRIAAADQVLSEVRGAAPANIDEILSALDRVQTDNVAAGG